MEMQIYKALIDPSLDSDLEVSFMALVDKPAIERNFLAFEKHKAAFTLNEEKRIIGGPAMIPDVPIYRKDAQLGEYFIVFDKPSIYSIATKFAAKGYMNNLNLFHDDKQKVEDVTIFSSFISDSELGVSPMKGYEDLPEGTWFIFAKVNDDDTWAKVKSGAIKGFSVEGLFNFKPVAKVTMSAEQVAATLKEIAKDMTPEQRIDAINIFLTEPMP